MTLRSSDLQSDSDLDSIRNSCDVLASECGLAKKPRCDIAHFNGNLKLRNALRGCKPDFGGWDFRLSAVNE